MIDQVPEFRDVLDARRRIAPYLDETPFRRYPQLGELTGAELFVKHENFQPTGAFKVRGGINLVQRLSPEETTAGVFAASTGNHGQSVAYAASLFGVASTIFVPLGANPVKVASMRSLGATVIEHGADFDEARERCSEVAAERGARYIHSGNEPMLIAGVATATLELLQREPSIDAIVVPVGGGSGAAGACIAAKAIDSRITVVGVQSEAAPAAYRAWRDRTPATDEMHTFAEGLQTRVSFDLPQRIMVDHLDDFVLVSDDQLRDATRRMLEITRTLVEPAGAAPLAAVLKQPEGFHGKRVALICSGANISPTQLRELLVGVTARLTSGLPVRREHARSRRRRAQPGRRQSQGLGVQCARVGCVRFAARRKTARRTSGRHCARRAQASVPDAHESAEPHPAQPLTCRADCGLGCRQ